jgi:uncharacterized protein
MEYRVMENINVRVSALGFGCMRLPTIGNDYGNIDKREAERMLHYALDQGVNYVDTAYPYHKGNSETFVGEALVGHRQRVFLATKMPTWLIQTEADFDKYLHEQLDNLQTDHIDFYLLHGLNKKRWPELLKLNVFDFLNKAVKEGKIRFPSFSFHDDLDTYKEIIDSNRWTMSQIQLNYMDVEYQAGVAGLEYAEERKIPVVVMEPLRGGKLVDRVPEDIMDIWRSYGEQRSPAEWAFKWVYDFNNVKCVLSGMNSMEQVKENVSIFSRAQAGTMTEEERCIIDKVRELYKRRIKVQCTGCGYCEPCPEGVAIPAVISAYNTASMYNLEGISSQEYKMLMDQGKGGDRCVRCGKCVEACPQNIDIPSVMTEAHQNMK